MSKNYSLAVFFVFAFCLFGFVWIHTGQLSPPSGNDAIWFHAGLLTLLVGTFVIEYRFTKPNDVFVNCLVAFASISTLTNPPHQSWWEALRWTSLACGIIAITLAWDPGAEVKNQQSLLRNVAYQVSTRVGSAKVLFSIVFLLALVSYFDFQRTETKLFAGFWAVIILTAYLDIPQLLRGMWKFGSHPERNMVGIAHSVLAPSIVYCRDLGAKRTSMHDFVGFAQTPTGEFHSFGVIIGSRQSPSENRSVVALLGTSIDQNSFNENTLMFSVSDSERNKLKEAIGETEVNSAKKIIGTVAQRSNISQLRFEILGKPNISAGSLLRVMTSQGRPTFYQVFDGVIEEEQTMRESARAYVEGQAEQVGYWDNERGGFETHDWVAPERSCVHLVDEDHLAPIYQLKSHEKVVGSIPNSKFPVNIDLNDLVLFHSAILGVTGSGKSFLTYSLVESCAAKGIKVVCVDPTGDYQKYLLDAVMLPNQASIEAFLNSDKLLGIVETSRATVHPIQQAKLTAATCLKWCKEHRTAEEILNPKAKVLVVFEEAHLLVPEWNFNPERSFQDTVSSISQIVLQARKYGLGFLVISQRTANVVKSILNQCNTVFSFQAFDETGFDFLRNYMGAFHVRSLPNLKLRHGILVGKASKSRRPIMVHFEEQNRALREEPASDMPLPPTET